MKKYVFGFVVFFTAAASAYSQTSFSFLDYIFPNEYEIEHLYSDQSNSWSIWVAQSFVNRDRRIADRIIIIFQDSAETRISLMILGQHVFSGSTRITDVSSAINAFYGWKLDFYSSNNSIGIHLGYYSNGGTNVTDHPSLSWRYGTRDFSIQQIDPSEI